jgi:hypothetical protein
MEELLTEPGCVVDYYQSFQQLVGKFHHINLAPYLLEVVQPVP